MREATRPVTSICLFNVNEQISGGGALPTRNSFASGTSFRISGKISLDKYSAASIFGSYAKLPTKMIEGQLSLVRECSKPLDSKVAEISIFLDRKSVV